MMEATIFAIATTAALVSAPQVNETAETFAVFMEDVEVAQSLGFLNSMTFMCDQWLAIKEVEMATIERSFFENSEEVLRRLETRSPRSIDAFFAGYSWIVEAYATSRELFPNDPTYAKQLACETAAEIYMPGTFTTIE